MKASLILALAALAFSSPAHARSKKAPPGILAAAQAAAEASPLPEGPKATLALLLAIAEHESAFRAPITRCIVKGDNGRAHGAYQLHREAFGDHTSEEVCADDRLQARLALGVLKRYLAAFPDLGIRGAVRGYASGHPTKDTRAAREIIKMWKKRKAEK